MTTPITGPVTKTVTFSGPANSKGFRPIWLWKQSQSSRQKKPYDLPLPYYSTTRVIEEYWSRDPVTYKEYINTPNSIDAALSDAAYLKAYEAFRTKVMGENPDLALNIAERQQALNSIEKRAMQLYRFSRALRRLRLGEAATVLRSALYGPGRPTQIFNDGKPSKREFAKRAFGDNYLEYHLGWQPLVDDIGKAVNLLQSDLKPIVARGRGSASAGPSSQVFGSALSTLKVTSRIETKWEIGGRYRVINPNVHLADQLGFINPAKVLWETVPFSFVVDWFVPVSAFLGSFTDFWGVALDRTYRTRTQNWSQVNQYTEHPSGEGWIGRLFTVDRLIGTPPGPALRILPPQRLSPARAATAVALLLQQLH